VRCVLHPLTRNQDATLSESTMFYTHGSLDAAFGKLDQLVGTLKKEDRITAYTGAYCVYNTTAKLANDKIESLETEITMLKKAYYELQYKGH